MGEVDMKDRDDFPVLGVSGDGSDTGEGVRATEDWVYDTDGSDADDNTLFGDVDGRATSLGGLKNFITEDVYTKEETDQAIDRLAAYYITSNAEGDAFATYAALTSATTYYSGGVERTPTRNDYAVVLADETHGGSEWRYIFAVPDGQTDGQWEPQYPIETNDYEALSNKPQINGVTLSGNKTAAELGVATPENLSDAIAPDFSTSATYAEGQLVNYNGTIYICTTAVTTPGPWTGSTNWSTSNATVQDAINAIDVSSQITGKIDSTSIARAFDAGQAYASGTYVTHEGVLYQFTADHAAGVSWEDSASLVETAVVMEPDATIDVVNGKLYVKNASGVVIWQEPEMPVPRTTAPLIAEGNGNAGVASDATYAKGSHVHPAETAKYEFSLPADCFPMKYTGPSSNPTQHTISSNVGLRFEVGGEYIWVWDTTEGAISEPVCSFYKSSLKYEDAGSPDTVSITFSKDGVDTAPTANTWPTLEQNTIYVRNVRVAKDAALADKVDKVNGTATGLLVSGNNGLKFEALGVQTTADPCTIRYNGDAFEFTGHMGSDVIRFPRYSEGTVALLQDFYAFVQQVAPAFTAKTYAVNDVCSYQGILYRCKDAYTATSSSATPNQDTTHWEAKPFSDLFLKTTGGTLTGAVNVNFGGNYTLSLGADASGTKLVLHDSEGHAISYEAAGINTADGFIALPNSAGTLALESDIPDISGKADSVAIDAEYDESDTYDEGDTCMHDGKWYTCNTAISTAEAWDPDHWTAQTVKEVMTEIDASKLDSTSAAPAFDPTQSYSVNEYVTYNGALYVCTTAHAAAAWNPAHFTLTNMVTPDATLDVTSAGALRVVAADGEILWQQGYKLDSTSATTPAVTLSNESVNYYASPANSPDDVVLTLPAITTNPPKVSDFILEVSNPALTKVYGDGTTTVAAYDSASTYAVDDMVSYNGSVWKCNTASTTGTWDPTYWDYVAEYILQYSTSTTYAVGARVLHTDSSVVKIYSCNTANTTGTWADAKWNLVGYYIPTYNSASTYAQGAKVIYGDGLYSCNTAGTTGTWDASKWDEAVLALSLGTALDNTISVVIPDGDDLSEMFLIGWGEMSEFYFTLTAFKVNGKPTYKIVKQVVVNGGAA